MEHSHPVLSRVLANFKDEREAFRSLLMPICSKRILIFQGESGSGKTSLIEECLGQTKGEGIGEGNMAVKVIPIQLRNTGVGVAEVFFRAGARFGWGMLPGFTRMVAKMQERGSIRVSRNLLLGINTNISVALHSNELEERDDRRALLTDAWFKDVQNLNHITIIALDTYEHAATEVQQWIEGPFLARVADVPAVRVLIAGQAVPDDHNIEWGHCAQTCYLQGISEATDWLPVVQAMGRHPPSGEPLLPWLAGVCHALRGRPSEIMKVIEGLPGQEHRL